MARYAITIFLSAFLLFQVQPIIGKYILPWYGGGPAVWTACMLFFQIFLLAGYAYAHIVASRLSPRSGKILHWGLLIASLAFLPIAPDAAFWKQSVEEIPVIQILGLLAVTIGLPYFLLSSTGPLLQESFRRQTGHTPYRLYALSNVGSLLALLSYPFVFEPQLALHTQIVSWSTAYGLFAVLSAWCILGLTAGEHAPAASDASRPAATPVLAQEQDARPTWRDVALWLALAACGSVLLLATTNQLCQEVTTVPFLWVLPLALYLSTFIICFDHDRWYHRTTFLLLMIVAITGASYAVFEGTGLELWKQLAIFSGALWICCMVCHGELFRARPAPRHATLFYVMVAAGGACGGVLVAVVAPLALPDFWEYQIALFATVLLAFAATFRGSTQTEVKPLPVWLAGGGLTMAVGLAIIGVVTGSQANADLDETNLETTRNFYGVLRVNRAENYFNELGPLVELVHGRIRHGFQYLESPYDKMPTTYYGSPSGIGLAINHHPRRAPQRAANEQPAADQPDTQPGGTLRIGVIGLGCGTIATFGRPGDTIHFYEINPEVARIANEYFSYCKDSAAEVDIVLGDARINLERELADGNPQRFDVLAVDAFSSDSIPMHLLTRECAELYQKHLKPDGMLCLHLSNRFLELEGVARGLAEVLGCECVRIDSAGDVLQGIDIATWVILTNNRAFLESPAVRDAITPWTADDPPPLVWTDDYGSLWQTLKN
jgi:hypothetical protein